MQNVWRKVWKGFERRGGRGERKASLFRFGRSAQQCSLVVKKRYCHFKIFQCLLALSENPQFTADAPAERMRGRVETAPYRLTRDLAVASRSLHARICKTARKPR